MKKTYIQPETIVVRLETEGMIAASLQISNKTVNTSEDGGQLTNKKESSIWGSDEEESNGSIW
jgi:hypothetical protein